MADIFISYKREDADLINYLVEEIQKLSTWSIWWDYELSASERFDDRIESELRNARCVIVVWSEKSLKSEFVKDEATFGLDQEKLVQVILDDSELPLRFRRLHGVDFRDPNSKSRAEQVEELVKEVKNLLIRKERTNLRDAPAVPELEEINGGTFNMGSDENENGYKVDEPLCEVSVGD